MAKLSSPCSMATKILLLLKLELKVMAQLTLNWMTQQTLLKVFENYSTLTCYDDLIGTWNIGFLS